LIYERIVESFSGKQLFLFIMVYAVKLRIEGKVQGVYYRYSAMQKALSLNLCGWVKNNADGTVSAQVQGAQASVESFIDWCRQGPQDARVDHVEIDQCAPGDFTDFTITR